MVIFMKYILSQTIFTGFVLAIYFAVEVLRSRELKYKENKLFVNVCIFSAIWSLGFFGVIMQTDPQKAYLWRAIGMVGTFGYLISAQYLVCHLSGIKRLYCRVAEWFSLLGIIIFFFVIQKDQVTYKLSNIGMTYSFHQTFWNNFYIWYTVVVAINQCMFIIHMVKNPKVQRLRELGKKLIVVESGMLIGMLLDTVFPLFGQPAIPGSTIGQFAGLAAMYHALLFSNHSRITISNMSEFIYYSLNVPVLVYDTGEKLQILNDTAYSFFGVENENVEQISIDKLFMIEKEKVFLFEEKSLSIDAVCCHNDKYCNLAVNKIYDDYGDIIGYIIIVTDLSERMKTVQQLEEAIREAEYANKAKSTFLANMSHEIRTPMNAIIGFSDILLKMNITQEVRNHIQDIKWSSNNLLAIINDILDISKIESGKMEVIPDNYFTASLLNDVVLIIEPQAIKKGLQFKIKTDPTIPKELYGDKVRIRGILINLLNNAVKYTKEGTVTFEVSILAKKNNKIKLSFRVEDTGIGIKEENINTLFDNFERLDQKMHYAIEGSGLGLAIVKGYVMLMGGDIKVSSQYGVGSVFTVELEQEIIDASPMEKRDIHGEDLLNDIDGSVFRIQNVRVLVVDDNPINLKVASGILRTYGLEVDTALGGKEAIDLCRQKRYKMVFMDQMMPEIDGVQAMLQIRQENSYYAPQGEGKIIVLTANAIKGTREMLIRQGFDEYLGKPLNLERLEALLCRFIPKENIVFKAADEEKEASGIIVDVQYLEKALPNVDVKLGIVHCGGAEEDYLKVLEITYKYGERQLNELRQLWEGQDYDGYRIKVHSLKSTSLNIGAREISEEAKRQEEAATNGDFEYIENNRDKLIQEYMNIMNQIKEVLSYYGMIPVKDTKQALEGRMVIHMLRNIEKHIDEFEFTQVFDILEETKKYQIPQKYEKALLQIETLMEDLSVEEIKDILREYIYE